MDHALKALIKASKVYEEESVKEELNKETPKPPEEEETKT